MLFISLILPSFVTAQQNTQSLRFEDAMKIMEENNPALHRAKQQIKQREYELKTKRALYMPQVSLSAKAISMSETLHLDMNPIKDAITPLYGTLGNYGVFSGVPNPDPATNTQMPFLPDNVSTQVVRQKMLEAEAHISGSDWDQVIQEKNFASLSADFMWPIFTGGKINGANKAAKVEIEMSKEELRQAEGDLLSELVSRYYGLSLAIQVAEVRKQMLNSMDKHQKDAEKLFENGMIAKVEFLHASVAKNEADREFKQSLRNIEIIRSGLAATLAQDSNYKIQPMSHLFINKELNDIPYWITKALANNPQLKQIEGKKQMVDIKNTVDKGNYLPTVAMMGTYNLAEKDLSDYVPDWIVGVGMKWTVFDGMARKNKIKIGNSMQRQVEYAEQKAHADLEAYLTKLYQELQMQMEQKDELATTLELSLEYSNSTEKAFNEGFATSTTVVEALTKVAQVKALRLKVLYDYDVSLARFLQTAGIPEQFTEYCKGENTITESLTK
jgi:outer membrane protein TolC